MHPRDEEKVSAAWLEAGGALGIQVKAPFEFRVGDRTHICLAFLPHFSGPGGLVIMGTRPPDFRADEVFKADAEGCGYAWSFLNIDEYQKFDDNLFRDTLEEWGYTGPDAERPGWL
jgi:hypothetical protein